MGLLNANLYLPLPGLCRLRMETLIEVTLAGLTLYDDPARSEAQLHWVELEWQIP